MSFDWNDYSADSDTEEVSLLLSNRSQSLILAAMQSLDFRSSWVEVDDATWDDIHAAIGEAYEEIMEEILVDGVPVGSVTAWVGEPENVPEKWLICSGTTYAAAAYPELYEAIADIFKTETHFSVPDMRDRFLLGSGVNDDVGELGGENQHILTIGEIPAHGHVASTFSNAGATAGAFASGGSGGASTRTIGSAGGGLAHNNMPAYLAVHWLIKALP